MEALGLLSRISVRGILADVLNEIAHTQVEAPYSTYCPITCMVIDDRSLEDGKGIERINQGLSANYRRIRKQARANWEASSARTPPAA